MFDVPTSEKYSIGKTLPKKEIKHLLWQLGSFPFSLFVFYKRFSGETDLRRLFGLPAQIWHDMKFHLCADNTQLCTTFSRDDGVGFTTAISQIGNCLADITN